MTGSSGLLSLVKDIVAITIKAHRHQLLDMTTGFTLHKVLWGCTIRIFLLCRHCVAIGSKLLSLKARRSTQSSSEINSPIVIDSGDWYKQFNIAKLYSLNNSCASIAAPISIRQVCSLLYPPAYPVHRWCFFKLQCFLRFFVKYSPKREQTPFVLSITRSGCYLFISGALLPGTP